MLHPEHHNGKKLAMNQSLSNEAYRIPEHIYFSDLLGIEIYLRA
jgi:hypothetical protein